MLQDTEDKRKEKRKQKVLQEIEKIEVSFHVFVFCCIHGTLLILYFCRFYTEVFITTQEDHRLIGEQMNRFLYYGMISAITEVCMEGLGSTELPALAREQGW